MNHFVGRVGATASNMNTIVKLRQWSGKDQQGMALKAKGLKTLAYRAYIKVGLILLN